MKKQWGGGVCVCVCMKKPKYFPAQLLTETTLDSRTLILFTNTVSVHCQHLIREQEQDDVLRVKEHSICLSLNSKVKLWQIES